MTTIVTLAVLLLLMFGAAGWLLAIDRRALLPVLSTAALVVAIGGFAAAILH